MRTVEQIVADLAKAREEEAQKAAVTKRFENELRQIYDEARKALGHNEIFPAFKI